MKSRSVRNFMIWSSDTRRIATVPLGQDMALPYTSLPPGLSCAAAFPTRAGTRGGEGGVASLVMWCMRTAGCVMMVTQSK
jgi:hypothetical protein